METPELKSLVWEVNPLLQIAVGYSGCIELVNAIRGIIKDKIPSE